jgi:tripartite-type tricarboxylate transporter receptor subunit TctC
VKDYAPITNFVIAPNMLVAHPSFPPKTIPELVAYGKANPGKINWASSGNGAGGHLALVMFALEAGIKVLHVPFRGAGPAVTAVLGGETQLLFANTGVFIGHIKAGKLRPVALAAMSRLPITPEVPTLNESGFPGFESNTYYGLLAPAGTPRPIIKKLHGELVKIIQSPEFVARFAGLGAFPVGNTPEEFAEANRKDVAKWGKIIRENGIKAD